jgi:hypothetical protein
MGSGYARNYFLLSRNYCVRPWREIVLRGMLALVRAHVATQRQCDPTPEERGMFLRPARINEIAAATQVPKFLLPATICSPGQVVVAAYMAGEFFSPAACRDTPNEGRHGPDRH